jgi:hypothetical protein
MCNAPHTFELSQILDREVADIHHSEQHRDDSHPRSTFVPRLIKGPPAVKRRMLDLPLCGLRPVLHLRQQRRSNPDAGCVCYGTLRRAVDCLRRTRWPSQPRLILQCTESLRASAIVACGGGDHLKSGDKYRTADVAGATRAMIDSDGRDSQCRTVSRLESSSPS